MSSEEWKKVNLENFANFKTGKLNSNAAEIEGIYPFFTCSPETYRINSFAFDCEAAILAGNNANGIFCLKYYKGKFNAYQRTYIITTDPLIADIKFVYYQLDLRLNRLKNISHGTATKYLTLPLLNEIEINLPSVKTQRRIVDILSALDDKIELNRQTNATLEAIAHAIFKEWFVNFNFPGATGEMVKSELGMIPMGWRVDTILSVAELLGGGTPSTKINEYWNGDIKWVSAKDVSNAQGSFLLDTERKITKEGVKKSSTKILPKNTTIVTARGTVGSFCILSEPMAMNQTNYGLKAKKQDSDYFIFFSLANLVAQLQQASYGTIFDTITTITFEKSKIIIPPYFIIQKFDLLVKSLMGTILNNLEQSNTLSTIRDTLLTKLMNGEIVLDNNNVVSY
ncbi:MAG: restriction endonuclease subunit S [Flexilinea sp.]